MNEEQLQELIAQAMALIDEGGTLAEADSLFAQAGAPFTFSELQAEAERTEYRQAFEDAAEALRQGADPARVNEVLAEDGFPSVERLEERFRNTEGDTGSLAERVGAFLRGTAETASLTTIDELTGAVGAVGALVPGGRSPGQAYVEDRDRSRGRLDRAQDTNPGATQAGGVGGGVGTGLLAARAILPLIPAATRGTIGLLKGRIGKLGGGAALAEGYHQVRGLLDD